MLAIMLFASSNIFLENKYRNNSKETDKENKSDVTGKKCAETVSEGRIKEIAQHVTRVPVDLLLQMALVARATCQPV